MCGTRKELRAKAIKQLKDHYDEIYDADDILREMVYNGSDWAYFGDTFDKRIEKVINLLSEDEEPKKDYGIKVSWDELKKSWNVERVPCENNFINMGKPYHSGDALLDAGEIQPIDGNTMRHSTDEEREAYDRMLERMSTPIGVDLFTHEDNREKRYLYRSEAEKEIRKLTTECGELREKLAYLSHRVDNSIELPKDANGEYIHVGDKVQYDDYEPITVRKIRMGVVGDDGIIYGEGYWAGMNHWHEHWTKLLDKRGVNYEVVSDTCVDVTEDAQIVEYEKGVFGVQMRNLTPEQAIEATLGRETCHIITDGRGHWECDVCGCDFGDHDSCDPNDPPACNYCPNCGAKVIKE